MLVKREVSNMSYPTRYGSSTVNSLTKKHPHKKQSIFMTSFATSLTYSTACGGSWLSGLHRSGKSSQQEAATDSKVEGEVQATTCYEGTEGE
jgi:hypothetical protein